MKKFIGIASIFILILSILSACNVGDSNYNSSETDITKNTLTNSTVSAKSEKSETPNKKTVITQSSGQIKDNKKENPSQNVNSVGNTVINNESKASAVSDNNNNDTENNHLSVNSSSLTMPSENNVHIHSVKVISGTSATCSKAGKTDGKYCTACGEILIKQQDIPATGNHNYVDNLCSCGARQNSIGLAFSTYGNYYQLSGIGTCTDKRIIVPSTYNGKSVICVAENAFKNTSSFYEIILPDSIRIIKARAFFGCKELKKITIPKNVTVLERETFSGCIALEKVVLPDEFSQILYNCFAGCTSLKSINLPDGMLKIWENAFYNCKSLEKISLPSTLNEIGQYAFADCPNLEFNFLGMKHQFKRISKGFGWSQGTRSCLVTCYDGEFDIFYD